jgi:hypothetical protein
MRTTIEIPDALYVRAKTHAARTSTSLKEFFIEALEEKLADQPARHRISLPLVRSRRPGSNLLTAEKIEVLESGREREDAS